MKGIWKPQSKNIKFHEYKKCLDGSGYQQECDKHLFRSNNHRVYPQKVCKNSLSPTDDKRCYENNIESKPRERNI